MEALRIRDFILDVSELENTTAAKSSKQNKVDYYVKLENDMDFVVNRKSKKSDKDIVFLVSQDLFYIKDNTTGVTTKLDSYNYRKQISTFFRDMSEGVSFEKVRWTTDCDTEKLYAMYENNNKRVLLRAGITGVRSYDESSVVSMLKDQGKIVKYFYGNGLNDRSILDCAYYIANKYNYNNAKYFLDILLENNGESVGCHYRSINVLELAEIYNCDINTFIEYITRKLYSQGIQTLDYHLHSVYRDYLEMNRNMYGKIKDKYPSNLMTQHDKVAMKYRLWNKYKDDLKLFNITEEYLNLEFSNSKYSIVVPRSAAEIIDEGVQQSNCVASYVERVKSGDSLIVFMRKTDYLEESHVTIEVKNGAVVQCKAYANRNTSKEDDKFIEKWAKEKNLKVQYK